MEPEAIWSRRPYGAGGHTEPGQEEALNLVRRPKSLDFRVFLFQGAARASFDTLSCKSLQGWLQPSSQASSGS